MGLDKRIQRATVGVFERFVHSEVAGSTLLLACTVAAMLLANSPYADLYLGIQYKKVGFSWGDRGLVLSVQHWINDLLMVVFFFVVGLEIKRELLVGQLSSRQRALLPVMAAIGGMVVPAVCFAWFNAGGEGQHGWGIPMATDIAFTLGVLSLFGKRVPIGLKVFLTALAIVDDLGAVLVIAIFYTSQIHWLPLATAGGFLVLIALANRLGVEQPAVYVPLAIGVWAGVLGSGVHATVSGVLVALVVPVAARRDPEEFLSLTEARVAELRAASLTRRSMVLDRSQFDAISDMHKAAGGMRPPALALEELFHPFVVFFILPLFALFNAGVALDGRFVEGLTHPVSLGVIAGLVLGKQVGITLFSWVAVKSGLAELPDSVRWPHVYGGACMAGIGFTMSLFVAELAYADPVLPARAKVGILVASLAAAAWGAAVLQMGLPRPGAPKATEGVG